jgi:ketosteroid isomerase-like protein
VNLICRDRRSPKQRQSYVSECTLLRRPSCPIFSDAEATARDGVPYRNTYTWYFQMKDGKVVKAIAFFDTRDFDEFWKRVSPAS